MIKTTTLVVIAAAAAAASGCSSVRGALGATKSSPDEFRIVTSAPLTLPPDYSLRPPRPGDPRPQESDPSSEAHAAIFGQDVGQGASPGEQALVAGAGAQAADPNARSQIDFESAGVVHTSENFADRVLAYQGSAHSPAQSTEDQESIRRATGGGAVTIQRREGGFKLPGT